MTKKKGLTFALWVLVILLFWWAWRDVSLVALIAVFQQLPLSSFLFLFLVNAIILLLFSSRWWLIVRALGYDIPYLALSNYRLASFGVSYFTPGPQFGGEPLQVYLLKKRHDIPTETALASVSLDKILELLANFTFLALGILIVIWQGLFFNEVAGLLIFISAGMVVFLLVYLVTMLLGRTPFAWLFAKLSLLRHDLPFLNKIRQVLLDVESQIGQFCREKPVVILQATVLSALIWLAMLGEYTLALRFFGLQTGLLNVLAIIVFARLAFLTPLPGGLGALEAGQVYAMQSLGFDPILGVSISLFIRVRDSFFGLLGLWLGSVYNPRHEKTPSPNL